MQSNEYLQITEDERLALIKTQTFLRDNAASLTAVPADEMAEEIDLERYSEERDGSLGGHKLFNMRAGCDVYDCGTVMCIGGWAKLFMDNLDPDKLSPDEVMDINAYVLSVGYGKPLNALFYPSDDEGSIPSAITPHQAADAIDNFLQFGDPRWPEVCPGVCFDL